MSSVALVVQSFSVTDSGFFEANQTALHTISLREYAVLPESVKTHLASGMNDQVTHNRMPLSNSPRFYPRLINIAHSTDLLISPTANLITGEVKGVEGRYLPSGIEAPTRKSLWEEKMTKLTQTLRLACATVALFSGTAVAAEELQMTSVYPGSFPIVGDIGKDIGNRISILTSGELSFKFNEPGALVAAAEAWDAVSTGAVDAAWYSPGFAQGIIPSASMFTSVPFGPEAPEYLAWYYYGGAEEIWDEIAARHNIKSVLCATIPPEASGWFREPIESLDDLQGIKMRFFGLGARVMEKLGVSAQSLPVGDTVPALELGTIDAAEISMPALDLKLGMQNYAKHYYFPGWHQQTSLFSLLINRDVWDGLSDRDQAAVNEVCRSAITESIAWGEAIQFDALQELEAAGVTFHKWSPEILEAMESAWMEVVNELSEDADFARVWASYTEFRTNYAVWRDLGYMR